jgi:dephospho-CoA kinase
MKPAIVGITGGIGSGKSVIAKIFSTLNIPVFYADDVAKSFYDHDPSLIPELIKLFGTQILKNGLVNKVVLAQIVFGDNDALDKLNALIHPRVKKAFEEWYHHQTAPYVLREAAIMIETESYQDCDAVILVTADVATRINRVMTRSNLTKEEVLLRMDRQWPDEKKRRFSTFEIVNDNNQAVIPQVLKFHHQMIERKNSMA